ncbi:MAG TPA: RiPP maturation radical SAM C-methyltransferase [Thermoanaerobaculia bacterium]|nr:RiPP maturation radical SAM C-methyltransferase [Thermoanaerobaculia bacterium]
MLRIDLINMPFASLARPSIALTQLKSVVERRFGDRVSVRILYLNQDFGLYMPELYPVITETSEATNSGLGDWFFREEAFPGEPDNTDSYLIRYFRSRGSDFEAIKGLALARRAGLGRFLDSLIARYRLGEADLVGFTSMFSQNVASFALAKRLKRLKPGMVTVMGGANCEMPMGQVIARHAEAIDYVFSGPALKSFPDFVDGLLQGQPGQADRIKGVFSRARLAQGPVPHDAQFGEELGLEVEIPLDYDEFLLTFERNFPHAPEQPHVLFETSRGCWWGERSHCTFCGLNGTTMAYRAMPADNAIRLLHGLFRYAGRVSFFESVDNILPRSYLTDVLPHLETPDGACIFFEVKADLKESEMEVLARAGVTEIQPGIEALATSTLKLMKKGTTSFQNLRFLQNCLVHGIRPAWNLLVGFPGEEEEVYRGYLEAIPNLVHLPPPGGVFPVRFDRFSPYYTRAAEYGLDLKPCDFYGFVYPFPPEDLADLAYYFVDRNFGARYAAAMISYIDPLRRQLERWTARWHRRDGGLAPELRFRNEPDSVVIDSRSGVVVEHDLGEAGAGVLRLLSQPRRAQDVADRLAGSEVADIEREIERLKQRGLVFQEGSLFQSLVLPGPATASVRSEMRNAA